MKCKYINKFLVLFRIKLCVDKNNILSFFSYLYLDILKHYNIFNQLPQ